MWTFTRRHVWIACMKHGQCWVHEDAWVILTTSTNDLTIDDGECKGNHPQMAWIIVIYPEDVIDAGNAISWWTMMTRCDCVLAWWFHEKPWWLIMFSQKTCGLDPIPWRLAGLPTWLPRPIGEVFDHQITVKRLYWLLTFGHLLSYMYTYNYIIYVYIYIQYLYMYVCIYTYICVYMYIHIFICVHIYIYMYIYMYRLYIYIYIHSEYLNHMASPVKILESTRVNSCGKP